jgi:cytochrome o ubiquinol oxidase operon protein cyoD
MATQHKEQPLVNTHATYASYITGFVLSVILTLAAYLLVQNQTSGSHALFAHPFVIGAISVLALIQFVVQLYFFLHLGQESQPRWKLMVLFFMVVIVLIIVSGSIWIMYNLNSRMVPTQTQINTYMQNQGGGM